MQNYVIKKFYKKFYLFFIRNFYEYDITKKITKNFRAKQSSDLIKDVSILGGAYHICVMVFVVLSLRIFNEIYLFNHKFSAFYGNLNILYFLLFLLITFLNVFNIKHLFMIFTTLSLGILSVFLIGLDANSLRVNEILWTQNLGMSSWLIFNDPIASLLMFVALLLRINQCKCYLIKIFDNKVGIGSKLFIVSEYGVLFGVCVFFVDVFLGGASRLWFINGDLIMCVKILVITFAFLYAKELFLYAKEFIFVKRILLFGSILGYIGIFINLL